MLFMGKVFLRTSSVLRINFFIYCKLFTSSCTAFLYLPVITGDTVTRLSIPIRGRGKAPEEGQR